MLDDFFNPKFKPKYGVFYLLEHIFSNSYLTTNIDDLDIHKILLFM